MSLQVWLPLRGDLNNYGLNNPTFTNSGATINNNGKIGKCYEFVDTSHTYIRFNTNETLLNTINNHSFSVCAWIKTTSNKCWLSITFSYRFYATLAYMPSNNITGNNTPIDGNWHHVCVTHDHQTLKNTFYVDGASVATTTGTAAASTEYTNASDIGHDVNATESNNFYFNGLINDVRIYDHCLSPFEVSEITKALVLHYKMDDDAYEPTINLAFESSTYKNVVEGQAYTASGWGGDAGTITYYKSGGYNNGPYKIWHKTVTGTGGIYQKLANDIHILSGHTYTFSAYVKASREFTDSNYSLNINRTASTPYSSGNRYIVVSPAVTFTTEWKRISKTFTATDADAGDYGEMGIIYNDDVVDYYVYLSCFQIEEKDHATPYTPGTRNITSNANILVWSNLQGHGSGWAVQSEEFNHTPIYKNTVTSPNTGNNAGFSIRTTITKSAAANSKLTLSFWKKLTTVYGKNLGGYIRVVNTDDTESTYSWSYNKANWANDENSIGIWDFIKATVTLSKAIKTIKYLYVYCDNATGGNCDFAQIKLETGDTPTFFADEWNENRPNEVSKVYDSSGYGNNGTISAGNLYNDVNTPRYKNCTLFNNAGITTNYSNSGLDEFTYSAWIKLTSYASERSCISIGGTYFTITSGGKLSTYAYGKSPAGYHNGSITIPLNTWTHVALVWTADKLLGYVNGVKDIDISCTGTFSVATTHKIGSEYGDGEHRVFNGCISDLREYATALSADDIKELYDSAAWIDNNGNVECFECVETTEDVNTEIMKTGDAKSNDLLEVYDYLYLPHGTWVDIGISFAVGDVTKTEIEIRYTDESSGRDLMGWSASTSGYFGVSASNTWELLSSYTSTDPGQRNLLVKEYTVDYAGDYHIGALGTSYSSRDKCIYHLKVWKINILVGDFWPAYSSGRCGLVNIANYEFYQASTTNATVGNDDNPKQAKIYSRYIESDQFLEI